MDVNLRLMIIFHNNLHLSIIEYQYQYQRKKEHADIQLKLTIIHSFNYHNNHMLNLPISSWSLYNSITSCTII